VFLFPQSLPFHSTLIFTLVRSPSTFFFKLSFFLCLRDDVAVFFLFPSFSCAGTLSVVCANADEAARAQSQLKLIIRPMYSSPPRHGSSIVKTILSDEALSKQYYEEVSLVCVSFPLRSPSVSREGAKKEGVAAMHLFF
jgi:hypothetical protein